MGLGVRLQRGTGGVDQKATTDNTDDADPKNQSFNLFRHEHIISA